MKRLVFSLARGLAILAAVVVALILAGGAGLAFHLSRAPLPLTILAPWLAERLSDPTQGRRVTIDDAALAWNDDPLDGRGRLEIALFNVTARGPDDAIAVQVGEADIGVSIGALMVGRVRPTRLALVHPRLFINRETDGSFTFALTDAPLDGAPTPPDGIKTDASKEPGAGDDDATAIITQALAALANPPNQEPLLGLLHAVSIRDGDIALTDRSRGLAWRVSPATMTFDRQPGEVVGRMALALNAGDGAPAPLEAWARFDPATGKTMATVSFSGVIPDRLATFAAPLALAKGIDVPLAGTLHGALGTDFRLESVDFSLTGGSGEVIAALSDGGPERHPVDRVTAIGRLDMASRRLTLREATAAHDGLTTSIKGDVTLAGVVPLGAASIDLTFADHTASLALTAKPEGSAIRVEGRLDGFEPARLTPLAPFLKEIRALDLPISGSFEGLVNAGGVPLEGEAAIGLGGGVVRLDGVLPKPLRVNGGTITAKSDPTTGHHTLSVSNLDIGGPVLGVSVDAVARGAGHAIDARLSIRNLRMERLGDFWPAFAARKPRQWMLENANSGLVTLATANLNAWVGPNGGDDVDVRSVTAHIEAENAAVRYFKPLPKATNVEKVIADFDGKDFRITTTGGEITIGDHPKVRAGKGDVLITNVGSPREDLYVDVGLKGPLRTILTVLDLPPLGYPAKLDIKPEQTSGEVDGRLKVTFPLFDDIKLDDVKINVTGTGENVALAKLVAGRDVDKGDVTVTLDTANMTVEGKARFDGAPVTVKWHEVFSPTGDTPRTRLEARGRPDFAKVASFAPVLAPFGRGPVDVQVGYELDGERRGALKAEFDLTPTNLDVWLINWAKKAGTAAKAKLSLHLDHGKLDRITDLTLDGAGASMVGGLRFGPDGEVASIDVTHLKTATVDATVKAVQARDRGMDVTINGPAFDLTGVMDQNDDDDPPPTAAKVAEAAKSPRLSVAINAARLWFGTKKGVTEAQVKATRNAGLWDDIRIDAVTPPKGHLSVIMGPDPESGAGGSGGAGGGRIRIDASDAGNALSGLDITDRVRGGTLKVVGQSKTTRARAPIEGQITLSDYTLVNAPALARILNAMSVTGLTDLLSGEGISFGGLTGRFKKDGDKLRLDDVRTAGGALGLTVEGDIDLGTDRAKLNGTIVPVYGVNRIIGQIPLLGDLLSGGPGQGIFAATWTLNGPLSDPEVSVNPLAMLAPGFLRQLFFSGAGGGTPPSGDAQVPADPHTR